MIYGCERVNSYYLSGSINAFVELCEDRHKMQFELLKAMVKNSDSMKKTDSITDFMMVTGPSSSGKTTFANILKGMFGAEGYNCTVISMDNYYLDKDEIRRRQANKGRKFKNDDDLDYETIEAIDVEYFREQMRLYAKGYEIKPPVFDFQLGKRIPGENIIKQTGKDMIIVEGIHALNPILKEGVGLNNSYDIYISPMDMFKVNVGGSERIIYPDQIRFMRRAIRDSVKRNSSLLNTAVMWKGVRAGEEAYMKPVMKYAESFFNSSLEYEILFLKKHFLMLYNNLDIEGKKVIDRIIDTESLKPFEECDTFLIPKTSIFNEFYIK